MRKQVFNLILILLSFVGFGQTSLNDFIFRQCTTDEVKHAQLGVSIADAFDGSLIGGHNYDKSFIPASSIKLLPTFIALDKLGKDYNFITKLAHSGQIRDSVLHGNIYVIGSGDPSLGSKRFSHRLQFIELVPYLTKKIKSFGIRKIEGDIIADESVFESYPIAPSWQWNDLGSYYASGAWGINVNENEYEVWYNSNKTQGEIADILQIYPAISDLKITSEVWVSNEVDDEDAYVFGGPYTHEKRIVGTIPRSVNAYKIRGSIPDPPKFLAQSIFSELKKGGVSCNNYYTQYYKQGSSDGLKIIDSIKSEPLLDLTRLCNVHSINLYAESFLKLLGYKIGYRGSGKEGVRIIEQYLDSARINRTVLNMQDGSGLSARNRVSPLLMTQFLSDQVKKFGIDYVKSVLPKAGEEGTVRRMIKKSPASENVWMKSGSMKQIMSYTGIMKTKSGRWISFSIMSNGYTQTSGSMRRWMEEMIEGIYLNG